MLDGQSMSMSPFFSQSSSSRHRPADSRTSDPSPHPDEQRRQVIGLPVLHGLQHDYNGLPDLLPAPTDGLSDPHRDGFHADLILPYRNDFQSIPMHGQFLVVQLESPDEAVLGRIVSLSSEGKLAFGTGEDFNIRAMQDGRAVPEDLREQYMKYRVNIRVLGVIRGQGRKLLFAPSHRRLPHVGSLVAFP